MAAKRLTPEEKAARDAEKKAKAEAREAKLKEKERIESTMNILKMMYENVRKSRRYDRYIVYEDGIYGVVDGEGNPIIPMEFSNITTSNDKVLKVYGAPTGNVLFMGADVKVSSVFDYNGNMLVKPSIYSRVLNLGKRGILLGQSDYHTRSDGYSVSTSSKLTKRPEWLGENGVIKPERAIYYIDYETLVVLEFRKPEVNKEKLAHQYLINTSYTIEVNDYYENIFMIHAFNETGRSEEYLVDIDEAIKHKQSTGNDEYKLYKPYEFWEEQKVISRNNIEELNEVMQNLIFKEHRASMMNEIKVKMKAGSNDKYYFGKRNGVWYIINDMAEPASRLYEKAKERSQENISDKKVIKRIYA